MLQIRDYVNNCYRFEYKQRFTEITDFEIYRCFNFHGASSVFLLKSLIRRKFHQDLKMSVAQTDVECTRLFKIFWDKEALELQQGDFFYDGALRYTPNLFQTGSTKSIHQLREEKAALIKGLKKKNI